MFDSGAVTNLLDINRAESVFVLFFLFVRDPALDPDDQLDLNEVLHDIFLGHSIPTGARKRLRTLYQDTITRPPMFHHSVDQLVRDLKGEKDALLSFVRILLRLISDDGMISKRHCDDLGYLLLKCNFSSIEIEELTEDEQSILMFALTGDRSTSTLHTAPLYLSLGCNPGASINEIKKAYRTLAMKYHPDRSRNDTSKHAESKASLKKFQDIQIAYTTLMSILEKEL